MVQPGTRRMRERWREPVFWSRVVQLAKTVSACVLSWVIVADLLDLPQSFLAPWSALLVVHSTVYRTFAQGARQVGAAVVGVVLAWAVGNWIGVDALAVALVVLVGLAVGNAAWFRGEVTTVAATALISLTAGFVGSDSTLLTRLADTGIGIAVGLLVNVVVWPPLWRRTAIAELDALDDRIGELLVSVADGLTEGYGEEAIAEWDDRTHGIEADLDRARAQVRQATESARLNPRRQAAGYRDPARWQGLLERAEQALAETRSMVRTLERRPDLRSTWHPMFRDGYLATLRESGRAIAHSDDDGIRRCRDQLDELVGGIDAVDVTPLWPVYGGLLVNLRNILDASEELAAAGPLGQPPLPFSRRARATG